MPLEVDLDMGEDLKSWGTVTKQDVDNMLVQFPPDHRPPYDPGYVLDGHSLQQAVVILNDLASGINELKRGGGQSSTNSVTEGNVNITMTTDQLVAKVTLNDDDEMLRRFLLMSCQKWGAIVEDKTQFAEPIAMVADTGEWDDGRHRLKDLAVYMKSTDQIPVYLLS